MPRIKKINRIQDDMFLEKSIKFCQEIEDLIKNSIIPISYMDAVIELSDRREIETDLAASYLSDYIKQKIQKEAEDLNFFEKTASLPF